MKYLRDEAHKKDGISEYLSDLSFGLCLNDHVIMGGKVLQVDSI